MGGGTRAPEHDAVGEAALHAEVAFGHQLLRGRHLPGPGDAVQGDDLPAVSYRGAQCLHLARELGTALQADAGSPCGKVRHVAADEPGHDLGPVREDASRRRVRAEAGEGLGLPPEGAREALALGEACRLAGRAPEAMKAHDDHDHGRSHARARPPETHHGRRHEQDRADVERREHANVERRVHVDQGHRHQQERGVARPGEGGKPRPGSGTGPARPQQDPGRREGQECRRETGHDVRPQAPELAFRAQEGREVAGVGRMKGQRAVRRRTRPQEVVEEPGPAGQEGPRRQPGRLAPVASASVGP